MTTNTESEPPAEATNILTGQKISDPNPVFIEGITVDLLQESVRVNMGPGFHKFISYVDFISSLNAAIDKDVGSNKLQEYILSPNTFFLSVGMDRIEMSMYYPECNRNIIYSGLTRESVIPNIVICHALKLSSGQDWKVIDTRYWCTNKPLSELQRKAYLGSRPANFSVLPFTNVYTEGNLCYGSNVRILNIKLPDFRPLHWYYEMLFTSPFNNDLGITALRLASAYRGNYGSWYEHLATLASNKAKFPYEELAAFY